MPKNPSRFHNERPGQHHDAASDGCDSDPVMLEVTDILDMHSFRPRDVHDLVVAYLEEARAKGFATVRIIHGKGIGAQREMVHAILDRTPFVASYQDAPAEAGGWGATVVRFQQCRE